MFFKLMCILQIWQQISKPRMWTAHKWVLIRKNQQNGAQHKLQTFVDPTSHTKHTKQFLFEG